MMTYTEKPTGIFVVVPTKHRKRADVKKDCARIVEKYKKRFGNDICCEGCEAYNECSPYFHVEFDKDLCHECNEEKFRDILAKHYNL